MAGTESTLFLMNIGFALYSIYAHILAMLIHAFLHIFCLRCALKFATKLHEKLGNYLYWSGLTRYFSELFFDVTFLSILNLHMVDWDTPFHSVMISNIISVVLVILISSVLVHFIRAYFKLPKANRV